MKAALLTAAIALAGCGLGAGTTTVGIWRPHRVVDTQVCVQTKPGVCDKYVEVTRDSPARSFGGGILAWFNPGYMYLSDDNGAHSLFAIDSHFEYMRGRGGLGLGGRIGANIAVGSGDSSLFTLPLTLVGHWGYPRWSLYGGAGYTPYATHASGPDMKEEIHGPHVMAGGRALLSATRSARVTFNIDVFQHFLQGVLATSATFAISIHF